MTNQEHPIVPSKGLKEEWESEWHHYRGQDTYEEFMAKQAAQWGADQELKACCDWLVRNNQWANVDIDELRDARRPKPSSLKEQALSELNLTADSDGAELSRTQVELIRKALESL